MSTSTFADAMKHIVCKSDLIEQNAERVSYGIFGFTSETLQTMVWAKTFAHTIILEFQTEIQRHF